MSHSRRSRRVKQRSRRRLKPWHYLVGAIGLLIIVPLLVLVLTKVRAKPTPPVEISFWRQVSRTDAEAWANLLTAQSLAVPERSRYRHESQLMGLAVVLTSEEMIPVWLTAAGFSWKNLDIHLGQVLEKVAANGYILPFGYLPSDDLPEPISHLNAPWPTGILALGGMPADSSADACTEVLEPKGILALCTGVKNFSGMGLLLVDVQNVYPQNPGGD